MKLLLLSLFITTSFAAQWEAPDYENQGSSLGYHDEIFEIPENMKERVNFWIRIYSQYNTRNGVLHDSRHVGVVYGDLDFSDIKENSVLNKWAKIRAQTKRARAAKREIKARLRYLHTVKDPSILTGKDLEVWKLFENIDEPNKFLKSASKNRLRFQLGQSDMIRQGIFYSGRYLQQMEEIFKREGIPVELTRIPFVESSFNIFARSKVGASGIWQFMRSTAKYRLRMNRAVDERNDAILSTSASGRFLRRNYEMLQSWPLAITGYNHGPNGMRRLSKRYETKDLGTIIEKTTKRTFGFASSNFYACFLAILHVEANADKYFGILPKDKPVYREVVKLPKAISWKKFLKYFEYNPQMARKFNPHIKVNVRKGRTLLGRRDRVFVPQSRKTELLEDMRKVVVKKPIKKKIKKKENLVDELGNKLGLPVSSDPAKLILRI